MSSADVTVVIPTIPLGRPEVEYLGHRLGHYVPTFDAAEALAFALGDVLTVVPAGAR